MATRTQIILQCDRCGKVDDGESIEVTTVTVTIGKKQRTFEACGSCLPIQPLHELMARGRSQKGEA